MLRLWLLPVISSLVASFGCASAAKRSEACVWPCLQAFLTRLHSQVSQRRTPVLVRVSARVHLHGLDTPALHLHFSETWTNLPKLAGINGIGILIRFLSNKTNSILSLHVLFPWSREFGRLVKLRQEDSVPLLLPEHLALHRSNVLS